MSRSDRRRGMAVAFVLGLVVACSYQALRMSVTEPAVPEPGDGHIFTTPYDPPRTNLEAMITTSDGQAFATLAMDPTYARPEAFKDHVEEFVYRAQRPLPGYVVWAASLGQPGAVPWALFVTSAIGIGLLAAAATATVDELGRSRRWVPLVLVLPGAFKSMVILTPEPLAVTLALMGCLWWTGEQQRRWAAVAALTATILIRELHVLVPVALMANDVLVRRRPVRSTLPLALAPLGYMAWIAHLHARYGVWPWDADHLSRMEAPFAGWIDSMDHLGTGALLGFGLGAALVIAALVRAPREPLTWVALALAASTVVLGENIITTEAYRPLLLMHVAALLVILPPAPRSLAL